MATGKEKVKVMTALENLPIEGATVITTDNNGNVLSTQITDANGMTDYITLQAPNPALSLDPETAALSYSTYNVEVKKDGYHTVEIHGVEILADVNSYLPVLMHPCCGEKFDPEIYNISKDANGSYGAYNENSRSESGASQSAMSGYYGFARNKAPMPRDPATDDGTVTVTDDLDDIYIGMPAVLQPFQSGTVSGPSLGVRQVFVPTYITVYAALR